MLDALRLPSLSLLLAMSSLASCGGGGAEGGTSSESSTTTTSSSTGESGTTDASETGTGTETGTETGEDPDPCGCAEDEMCVATADDFCGDDFGYMLECVPAIAACADNACDPACLEAACGNEICTPPCGQLPHVDVWCAVGFALDCDPLLQDCPEGEKCVPYSNDGAPTWNDNKCVPITGDGQAGDPCMSGGIMEGNDNCGADSFCFGIDDALMGTCYDFCQPDEGCALNQDCMIANEGVLTVCLDVCVPHHPEGCAANEVCVPIEQQFLCTPGIPTLDPNAACEVTDVCAPGQTCVPAAQLDGCAGQNCCTDLCDTSLPDPCTPPLTCVPVFPMGQAPAGLEDMGSCRTP